MRGTGTKNQDRNLIKHGAAGSSFPDRALCPGNAKIVISNVIGRWPEDTNSPELNSRLKKTAWAEDLQPLFSGRLACGYGESSSVSADVLWLAKKVAQELIPGIWGAGISSSMSLTSLMSLRQNQRVKNELSGSLITKYMG